MAHENIYGPGNDNYGRDKKIGLSETEKRKIMAHEKERAFIEELRKVCKKHHTMAIMSDIAIEDFLSTLPEEKEEKKSNSVDQDFEDRLHDIYGLNKSSEEKEEKQSCDICKYQDTGMYDEPCSSCLDVKLVNYEPSKNHHEND
jgi:hypothetical protein